jgi:hypothetical protein
MYQKFIILYLYEAQHVSDDTPPIIRSLKLHWQPLVFHTWKVSGRVVAGLCQAQCAWQRPPTTRPTIFHVWKTRGSQCSFRLLMMGGVSPETCWASYKYGKIKFWYIVASCWIFLYELYYNARIHEQQDHSCVSKSPPVPHILKHTNPMRLHNISVWILSALLQQGWVNLVTSFSSNPYVLRILPTSSPSISLL